MNPSESLAAQLKAHLGDKTLATLRADAAAEMNGVGWISVRPESGPRQLLICCITAGYERQKLDALDPEAAHDFGDWASVSLCEAALAARFAGGFIYALDFKNPDPARAVVLIAADPRSITSLEAMLRLPN